MAVLSCLGAVAFWPAVLLLADALRCQRFLPGGMTGFLYVLVLTSLVVSVVLGGVAGIRVKRSQGRLTGWRFAQLAVSLGMANVLLGVSVLPDLLGAKEQPKYDRAVNETKIAVTQVMAYAKAKGVYPTSLRVLRAAGIGTSRDQDPWGKDWVLSPALAQGSTPKHTDDVYVFSRGPRGTGTYRPGTSHTGQDGAVGYSSVHGAFKGC